MKNFDQLGFEKMLTWWQSGVKCVFVLSGESSTNTYVVPSSFKRYLVLRIVKTLNSHS